MPGEEVVVNWQRSGRAMTHPFSQQVNIAKYINTAGPEHVLLNLGRNNTNTGEMVPMKIRRHAVFPITNALKATLGDKFHNAYDRYYEWAGTRNNRRNRTNRRNRKNRRSTRRRR